jgi:hypothetical protein
MKTNISNVTDLDFYTIKDNLIEHFKQEKSPFKDWDFKGSGLNYLLDVLAYNTHYNAVNAHVSMNETFLDSAQVRSNVVSSAKILGYTPRSNRGAKVVLNVEFSRLGDSNANVLILPRGSKFTAKIDNRVIIFTTLSEYISSYDENAGVFAFKNIIVNEGRMIRERFVVNSADLNKQYKIKEQTIDTSTLRVNVYPHDNTSDFEAFLDSSNFTTYTPESNVYFLTENYDGVYQIEFGDGIIGKALNNLQVIEIEYLATIERPENGNSISGFIFGGTTDSEFNNIVADIENIRAVEAASGGRIRETLNEIRKNAPLSFVSQNRAVTVSDYETLIRKNVAGLDSISVWGGQDNDPPQFGKVFLSAKPNGALFLTELQKEEILEYLNTIKILTVKPEIVDPIYLFLYFDIIAKYNPALTTLTKSELENDIRKLIEEYNFETLGTFDKIFRYSNFLSIIDETDAAITNSFARVYCYQVLQLPARSRTPQKLNFKFELFGSTDQKESVISSTSWVFGGRELFLADEPIADSENRRIYAYTLTQSGGQAKVFNDLGILNIKTGLLDLTPIPSTFDTSIQVSVIPNSYDINTIRDQLIAIDFSRTSILAEKETSNIKYKTPSIFRN